MLLEKYNENDNIEEDLDDDYVFDEEDDIILPTTVWGELYYIWCVIKYMIKNRQFSESEYFKLKRQIYFWKLSRGKL